jgi:hypothetical protein
MATAYRSSGPLPPPTALPSVLLPCQAEGSRSMSPFRPWGTPPGYAEGGAPRPRPKAATSG